MFRKVFSGFLVLMVLFFAPFNSKAQKLRSPAEFIPELYNPRNFNVPVSPPGILTFPLEKSLPTYNKDKQSVDPKKKIYLVHANNLSYDRYLNPDFQILSGDVQFRHEGADLFCDSAHLYQATNSLYAFGNVHLEQGDSLFLYGAWLFYEGFSKVAKVREKVRLENGGVTLFTDSLNYDRISNVSYFFNGGLLVDSVNEMASQYGQYSSDTKLAEFRHDVKLTNPNFVLTTRKLNYNTVTKVADIVSPTNIVSDSGYIVTSQGWYNTITEESKLFNRSYAVNERKRLVADTLYYNSAKKLGEGFGNILFVDSVRQVTMKGDYGYSDEIKDSAFVTKNALFIDHSSEDTLHLHADTLITYNFTVFGTPKEIVDSLNKLKKELKKDSLPLKDSLKIVPVKLNALTDSLNTVPDSVKALSLLKPQVKVAPPVKDSIKIVPDSVFRAVKAFAGVRFYRNDIQGICDTLFYTDRDSVMHLLNLPVIWSEKQQLSGENMKMFTKNSKPDVLHVMKSAIAVSYEVDSLYNQFAGKEIKAYFDSTEVIRVELSGNVEAAFIPRDDKNEIMGFNKMEGSSMTIFRKDGKMEKLILWPQPKGKFYPLEMLAPDAKYLKTFEWLEPLRPVNADDVMRDVKRVKVKPKSGK